jgi:hypothetical protein
LTSEFERAVAVTAAGEAPDGARFATGVHEGWGIGGNANGGYLMAIAARAMHATTGRPPLTLTAHFGVAGRARRRRGRGRAGARRAAPGDGDRHPAPG